MVSFFGDYNTTETVIIPFNTFTSNDPAASATITNLVAGDVEIHKDGGAVQRASDNGVTVTIDFDSVTGNHIVSIDLSDNSDVGFYANGSRYQVRIEGTTVDGGTINAWIGAFSIGCTLRPTTTGRTLDVTATGAAGIDWGNVENQATAVDLSGTDIQLCDTITTYTGNTVQTGDAYGRLGAPAGASVSADIAAVKAETALIVADTNELQTDWVNGGRLDLIVDAILVDTAVIGAAGAGLSAVPWNAAWDAQVESEVNDALVALKLDHLVAVADADDVVDNSIIAKLADSGATADWSAYVNTTDSLRAVRDRGDSAWTTGAGTGLTPLASGTAQSGTASTIVLASGEAFADNVLNGNVVKITAGTGAGQSRVIISNTLADDTCNVAPNWTTNPSSDSVYEIVEGSVNIEAISLDNAAANNLELDYDGTGYAKANSTIGTLTTYTGNTVQTGDNFARLGAPAGASVSADVAAVKAETALIVADTNELQTDDVPGLITALNDPTAAAIADAVWDETMVGHVTADTAGLVLNDWQDGGRLDLLLDAIPTTAMRGTDSAALASVCTEGRLAELDAANLPTDVAGIQTDLDNATDGLGALKALIDALPADADVLTQVNAALDTAISELGVAVPTATPTLRTGLMLLYMALRNKLVVQTSGIDAIEVHNDAGTKIASKAVTDDGSDYTEAKLS